MPHDSLAQEYIAKEEGYIYVYVSNENSTLVEVYFDDVKVIHTPGKLIQMNEYYPFGLPTANSWTRDGVTGNNFLSNGGTELNDSTAWFDLAFRNYDPAIGRMNGVDPMAGKYAGMTPYNYSFNDPVTFSDPSGADPGSPDYFEGAEPASIGYRQGSIYTNNWGWVTDDVAYEYVTGWKSFQGRFGVTGFGLSNRESGQSLAGGWQRDSFAGIHIPSGVDWSKFNIDSYADGAHIFTIGSTGRATYSYTSSETVERMVRNQGLGNTRAMFGGGKWVSITRKGLSYGKVPQVGRLFNLERMGRPMCLVLMKSIKITEVGHHFKLVSLMKC